MSIDGPILLFDGHCNLCSASVQFVLKRDRKSVVRFASLQSDFARQTLATLALPNDYSDSLVLVENGKIRIKSDAALHLTGHLNGLWPLMKIFLLVPRM